MITTTHHVSLTVTEQQAPGYFTAYYAHEVRNVKAMPSLKNSGSSYSSDGLVTEWADYGSLEDAVAAHARLVEFLGCAE